jgi:hypothetical protein
MSNVRRTIAAAGLGILTILGAALPAAAEDGFNSTMTDWLPGVSSRTWSDRNADRNSTDITLGGCRARSNPTIRVTVRIQLTLEKPWYQPDQSKGRKDFACSTGTVVRRWGSQERGRYHFTLTHVNGQEDSPHKVSASTVKVRY